MKPIRVTAAQLARQTKYSPAHITALTKAGHLKRVNGLYDLEKSRAVIREREAARVSDGGKPVREIEKLRAQNIELKNALLQVDLIKAQRATETGNTRPVAELKRILSLLILGARLTLQKSGDHIANDALLAGILPILANEEDRVWHDAIKADCESWVAQFDAHTARALALYVECLAVARGSQATPEDAATVERILLRFLDKAKDLPPVLPREEYERQAFERIMAKGREASK